MNAGMIGIAIVLMTGFLTGSIAYLTGWSEGWDDHKKFMFTELDRKDDECIVYIVRGMANELRGGQNDKD